MEDIFYLSALENNVTLGESNHKAGTDLAALALAAISWLDEKHWLPRPVGVHTQYCMDVSDPETGVHHRAIQPLHPARFRAADFNIEQFQP